MDDSARNKANALMVRARDGDRDALTPLYALLWPPVIAFCRATLSRYSLPGVDAEDVAQEALLRLFGQLGRFDTERDGVSWAVSVAAWECRSAQRKASRRALLAESRGVATNDDAKGFAKAPDQNLRQSEQRQALTALIDSLAPREREAVLGILEGNRSQVGALWRQRRARALRKLRALLGK